MRRVGGLFLFAILAGFCIGLGGTVFLRLRDAFPGGNVVGALLFTIGLFTICTRGYALFTGKACYLFENPWPGYLLDLLIIAPCTGSTLGKLACGIADTTVTLAAKAHLRNCRPILLAPSTNDGLAASARNLGQLMARKYIYLVPFRQDDPEEKPASLVADFSLVADAAQAALEGRQLQPVLLGPAAP